MVIFGLNELLDEILFRNKLFSSSDWFMLLPCEKTQDESMLILGDVELVKLMLLGVDMREELRDLLVSGLGVEFKAGDVS